jgi:hypothetical protein
MTGPILLYLLLSSGTFAGFYQGPDTLFGKGAIPFGACIQQQLGPHAESKSTAVLEPAIVHNPGLY